jgi:hypothetical protein
MIEDAGARGIMGAETQSIIEEIEQSAGLLRRAL